jgi:ATP-dependent protease ClpP protease subunit
MEEYEEILEMSAPEEDKAIKDFATQKRTAMLALIAPYAPEKISPTVSLSAELSPPEEFGVENFIMEAKKTGYQGKLYLLLHSFGGGIEAAYVIAKALRDNFEEIITFVPQIAASGATLIAISSDKIVMGEISRLSPIDVQIFSKGERKSALALRGFSKLAKTFGKTAAEEIGQPYRHLIESIDLATFEEWGGVLEGMRNYATELLKKAGYDNEKSGDIADRLVYEFPSHSEVIDFGRAKELGLKIEWYEGFREEWMIMRRWLAKYLLEESSIHHIRYCLPERSDNGDE